MKIAIIQWNLNISGGNQRQAVELANYLAAEGHPVKVYCVYLDRDRCYPNLIKNLDVKSVFKEGVIAKHFANLNISEKFFFPAKGLLQRFREARMLIELMDRDFDVLNCHDIFEAGYLYKKRYGSPVVWMLNDIELALSTPRGGLFKRFIFPLRGGFIAHRFERKVFADADKIAVLNFGTRDSVKRHTGRDAVVIRSGLDIDRFKFVKRKLEHREKDFKILTIGIFFPRRRYEDLLRAMDILKKEGISTELNLIGSEALDMAYANKIRRLAGQLNLNKHVNFRGAVSEEQLIRSYSEADAFVFPNNPETWGIAVFEAMACGTPVLVSTGTGASEVLTEGKNALLFPPEKPGETASCLKRLFSDPSLWERLSINGRKFVEENIRWDIYGKNMLRLFEEAAESR